MGRPDRARTVRICTVTRLEVGFSAPVEKLASSYAFAIVGSDRVASRTATVIAITPHDRDRYSYKLWLDEQSNLVLKSIILNSAGHTLEHDK